MNKLLLKLKNIQVIRQLNCCSEHIQKTKSIYINENYTL